MRWIIATHATFVTVAMAVATAGDQNGVPQKYCPASERSSSPIYAAISLTSAPTNSAAA